MRALVFLALFPLSAMAQDGTESALLALLDQYSENAGRLQACGTGPGATGVTEHVDMLAEWKHPSFWDGLFGARESYREELHKRAMTKFRIQSARICASDVSIGTSDLIVRTAGGTIKRKTNSP